MLQFLDKSRPEFNYKLNSNSLRASEVSDRQDGFSTVSSLAVLVAHPRDGVLIR